MRFDFKKIFFARFFSNKVTKELDGYELYWYFYSVTLVLQLYVFFKAIFKTVASYMFLIRVLNIYRILWSLSLILIFKDTVDFRGCPSRKKNTVKD